MGDYNEFALTKLRRPCLPQAQAFLQAFLERTPDGHRFAHAFHLQLRLGRAPTPAWDAIASFFTTPKKAGLRSGTWRSPVTERVALEFIPLEDLEIHAVRWILIP